MFCSYSSRDGLSGLSTSNPLTKFATSATSHLSGSHIDYLIHWTGLLLLEESQIPGPVYQKDLWCLNPQQRYVMKLAVFYIIVSCSLVAVYRCFRGACCLYHQGAHWMKITKFRGGIDL
jgi:hypothetical protein